MKERTKKATLCVLYISIIILSQTVIAQESLPSIIKRIKPSTVVIFTYDSKGEAVAQGSGFFVSQSGEVITNRHVIEGAFKAEVKANDGKVYEVKQVLAVDKEGDVAKLSLERYQEKTFSPLTLSAAIPEVGEKIIVIGSPLGLEQTVSDGIVSAVRDVLNFGNIIQISAPISPGSSGGPVINMKGEVIGIATFQSKEGQNLNFAIPSERINKLAVEKAKSLAEWNAGVGTEGQSAAEGLYQTGLTFLWADDCQKALPYFKQAVKINPQYSEAYRYIGFCYGELGQTKEAIEAFKQAIRINPDDAKAHYNLGVAYGKLGRNKEEIEAFKQALRINPDDAKAHYNLGCCYSKFGRHKEAIESYKQAIRIQPGLAEPHFNLGLSYLILGDNGAALGEYKILKELNLEKANELFNAIYK